MSHRVLDPLDRTSEILFGIIMVLTFTGSIRVAEAGQDDLRTILSGAIGCNLAWGVVDATMYLMSAFITRARQFVTLKAIRQARTSEAAHHLILGLLPSAVSSALAPSQVETLLQRLNEQALPSTGASLTRRDFLGAAGVFLLVFLSTLPVLVPLMVVREPRLALALSNAVAVLMLFVGGWKLGQYAGRPGWRSGLVLVGIGIVLVAITMALGG